jgi:hypothetical protein
MDKKAIGPVIATVLLVSVSLFLATLIISAARNSIFELSPPVNCEGLNLRAEVSVDKGEYFLDVENLGVLSVDGFQIKSKSNGEINLEEEILMTVEPGKTESVKLKEVEQETNLLITPMIFVETRNGKELLPCKEVYNLKV